MTTLLKQNTHANTYCVLVKAVEGKKGGYRWTVLMVNRRSDRVAIPQDNVHSRDGLADALVVADRLRQGTARPLHISLAGYANELSQIDADVCKQVTGENIVQRWKPVDPEFERIKYYTRPESAWGEGNEMVRDVYDLSASHYGLPA